MKIKGVVVKGERVGRELGFPTANLLLDDTQGCIESGVYASRVIVEGSEQPLVAISNVGNKPTLGSYAKGLECHILDFEGDLYGRCLEVELLDKIRPEQHFESIEALREQIAKDIEQLKELNNRY